MSIRRERKSAASNQYPEPEDDYYDDNGYQAGQTYQDYQEDYNSSYQENEQGSYYYQQKKSSKRATLPKQSGKTSKKRGQGSRLKSQATTNRQQDRYQQAPDRTYYDDYENQQAPQQNKVPKKKKKRRRPRYFRIFTALVLLILLFSAVTFFMGKSSAEKDTSIPKANVETFNGAASSNGSKNILLIGSDSREGETSRADTIMIVNIDSGKPKLVSIMRDTYVAIPGHDDNKINASYAFGGAELLRKTIAENFGIQCQYYAMVDFQSFEKVIDALFTNGVKINAEKDLELDGVTIKKGEQRMEGHVLLQYARFRKDAESDFGRIRRQQQVMSAVFSQIKSPSAILHGPYAAGKVFGYTSTNLPTTFLLANTFNLLKGAGGIDTLSIPIEGSWSYGSSYAAGSYLAIDKDSNAAAAAEFLAK